MKPITGQWYHIWSVSAGPTPVYINLLTLFVNIGSINDDGCSVTCVGSSIICKRLNWVKKKLMLVGE
jgi:hypothetical protein